MKSRDHEKDPLLLWDSTGVGFHLMDPIQVDFNYNGVPKLVMKQTGFVAISKSEIGILKYSFNLVFVSKAGIVSYYDLIGKEDIRIRRIQNASWLTKKL